MGAVIGAAISAAAALVGSLMQTEAAKKQQQEALGRQARQQAFETEMQGQKQLGMAQQGALSGLLENLKGVYQR